MVFITGDLAYKLTRKGGECKMAYCVKCKKKVDVSELSDVQEIVMKNGRPAGTGVHKECGTKVFQIGGFKK